METRIPTRPCLIAMSPTQEIKIHVVQTFVLLVFAMMACVLLLPEAVDSVTNPDLFQDPKKLIMGLGGIFTLLVLFLGPLIMFISAIFSFRAARALDRLGVITKGSILRKWVDAVDEQPSYRVSYQFKNHVQAWQVVPFQFYEETSPGQDVEVLYLEQSPYISRLDLGERF